MTAQIVTHAQRRVLPYYSPGRRRNWINGRGGGAPQEFTGLRLADLRAVQGQLWERIAEGKTR